MLKAEIIIQIHYHNLNFSQLSITDRYTLLTRSIRLIYHGLYYSPPRINKPETKNKCYQMSVITYELVTWIQQCVKIRRAINVWRERERQRSSKWCFTNIEWHRKWLDFCGTKSVALYDAILQALRPFIYRQSY